MDLMNKPVAYGLITKIFHWLMAVMILGLLTVGYIMVGLPMGEGKFWVYTLHKSFGLLILFLVIMRVFWHIISRKPKPVKSHARQEKILSRGVHFSLYALMLALPLSGWVMSSAGGYGAKFFNLQLPSLVAKNNEIFKNAQEAHEIIAFVLIVFVLLHAAGAFKHHFINQDSTIKRMTSEKVGFIGGMILVFMVGMLMLPPIYFLTNDIIKDMEEVEANVQKATLDFVPTETEEKEMAQPLN